MICFVILVLAQVIFLAYGCPETIATVHIQNHDGPIYVSDKFPNDHQLTIVNQDTDCCNTCGGRLPINHSTCSGNQPTYTGNQPTYTCGNQSPVLHSSQPIYPVYEHDCKCVSKNLNPVPINTVSQSGCHGYGQPGCSYVYPDYSTYGYYYPEGYGSGETCPNLSEGLIPLLKSYLGHKSKNRCGQCGQSIIN